MSTNSSYNIERNLKHFRRCTHMAITHLAQKLQPITPQLELLRDMCFHFHKSCQYELLLNGYIRNCYKHGEIARIIPMELLDLIRFYYDIQYDIFELLTSKQHQTEAEPQPMVEIGVSYFDMKNEKPPQPYEILKKSVSGKDGDLAKHGNRKTYLYFKRSNDSDQHKQKPITAITLISPDYGEEPPLGFEMIERTPASRSADLTYRGRHSLFLCVHRGDGPPITRLGVVHIKKEKVPVGWHHIQRTPSGKRPELDQGATMLAYTRDYKRIILRFKEYSNSGNDDDLLISRCFACLVAGIYSFDRATFLRTLEAFTSLDSIQKFPAGLLTDFLSLVRDSLTAYISLFNREVYVKVLKWLGHVYKTRAKQLDSRAFINMLHLCMFCRHEDAREQIGKSMLQNVIQQSRKYRKPRSIEGNDEKKRDDEDNSDKDDGNVQEWLSGIVKDLADHVAVTKSTQNYSSVIKLMNTKLVDAGFHEWVSSWSEELFSDHFDRLMAASLILLAKVSSQRLPTKLTAKSEVIKRRIHALKLLAYVLEESVFFFKDDSSALLLLRRIVFTSYSYSAITSVPAVFKTMFRLYEIFWSEKYRKYLKYEIGILLDVGMVGLLQSQFCTPPQKIDLLEGLMQMFKDKSALINMFYNYDCSIDNWPVCQKLINVVAKLTEVKHLASTDNDKVKQMVVKTALKLLTRFIQLMARYLRAPGLNEGGNLDDQQDFDTLGTQYDFANDDTKINESQGKVCPNSNLMQNEKKDHKEEKNMDDADTAKSMQSDHYKGQMGNDTWAIRHDQHLNETKIVQQALRKARQDKVKTAVKFLLAQGERFATLKYIAEFLYSNNSLDKEEVGEFISALETSALTQTQHRDLLSSYMELLDFTGQSFDVAFRTFLTDCGFYLPKEAQKIDRLMDAFARAFNRDNPTVFTSNDQPLILAYGVLMGSWHGLRNRDSGLVQSKATFIHLVQSDNNPIPSDIAGQVFDSFTETPLQTRKYSADEEKNDADGVRKQFRNECTRLLSKSLAKMREHAIKKHSWRTTKQREILKTLYQETWLQFLAGITNVLGSTHHRVDAQMESICLDTIKYSCVVSICLGLNEQLQAFASELARFVYIEQNKHLLVNARHLATVRGEHLKQQWFINVMNYAPKSKSVACEIVSRVCNDIQARVVYDADQKILRDIEVELGSNLHLIHPDRRFIHAGPLTKQSTKGDLDLYRFYLFNDLLIYASGKPGNYSVRRSLHLSLCKIIDLRDGFIRNINNSFRVVSPQKPILLIAATAQEKKEWFQLIQAAIQEQVESRAKWIDENQTLQEYHETQRISQYLGRAIKPKKHELDRIQNGKSLIKSEYLHPDTKYEIDAFNRSSLPCKLCQKPFKRFTRKAKCPWCLDVVCKECLRRETQLPQVENKHPHKAKVCDACYGAIIYFIGDTSNP